MKNDERIKNEIKSVKNVTYHLLWTGIFIVLLYRWFVVGESLRDTMDIFLVWLIASLIDFFMMALKGIPLSFPIELSKKEQIIYIVTVPFFASFIPVVILLVRGLLNGIGHALITYIASFGAMILIYTVYKVITYLWEKKNLN